MGSTAIDRTVSPSPSPSVVVLAPPSNEDVGFFKMGRGTHGLGEAHGLGGPTGAYKGVHARGTRRPYSFVLLSEFIIY